MKFKFLLPILSICTLLFACGNSGSSSGTKVKRAFYQWNSLDVDERDDSLLRKLDIQTLYIHFFDIDVYGENGYPYPINVSSYWAYFNFALSDSIEVVPTVFITNKTFSKMSDSTLENLAHRVEKKIKHTVNQIADSYGEESYWFETTNQPYLNKSTDMRELQQRDSTRKAVYGRIKEIQFDCDWTPSTKDKYFSFLEKMKLKFNDKLISSTIRLYPYKYPEKAGVPPVDKGMLMCYNAGNIRDVESGNSIFDKKEILSYLDTDKPYPLLLDYALPIFSWCAVYRDDKLMYLLSPNEFDFEYGNQYELLDKSTSNLPMYEVKEEHVLGYQEGAPLLKQGDLIKMEQPNLNDVAIIAKKLGAINKNPQPVISLYHFGVKDVIEHEKSIQKIYDSF